MKFTLTVEAKDDRPAIIHAYVMEKLLRASLNFDEFGILPNTLQIMPARERKVKNEKVNK